MTELEAGARLAGVAEILERAHSGPICSLREWDIERVPSTLREKLQKYDLVGTFTRDDPVATDDELADRFFKAGYEVAHELGVYCQDTERTSNSASRNSRPPSPTPRRSFHSVSAKIRW